MNSLATYAKNINCRELKAIDRTVSGWIFICKLDGKPTDYIHCGLCQKKKPIVKEGDFC